MCCNGIEILKVFEKSKEICEGDEREWVPSISSAMTSECENGIAYIVSAQSWVPRE